jgi:transposase-like protein
MTWQSLTPQEKRDAVRELVETQGCTYRQAADQLGIETNMIAGVIDRAKRAKQPIKTTSGYEFSGTRGRVRKVKKQKQKQPPTAVNTNAINARRRKAKQRPRHSALSPHIVTPPAIAVEPFVPPPGAWVALPGSHPLPVAMHVTGCRFPIGENPTLFCCEPTDNGVVYCPHHYAITTRVLPSVVDNRLDQRAHRRSAPLPT